MSSLYAQVVVDIDAEKLDRPFSYRVPEALQETCVPGSAVRIPFGRGDRQILGYVVALSDKTELAEDRIKSILSVEAGEETAEGRLVALAAWMSRRYGSTMIRAMKTVFPVRKKIDALLSRKVSLAEPARAEEIAEAYEARRHVAKARVVRVFISTGRSGSVSGSEPAWGSETVSGGEPSLSMDLRELQEKAKVSRAVIDSLVKDGVLKIEVSEIFRKVTKEAAGTKSDTLTDEQRRVCQAIRAEWNWEQQAGTSPARCRPVLLQGITGSGKTVVYTELIADTLARGEQAIVLIPEIALTWQTVLRFVRRFGDKVSFLHSRLSGGERYDQMKAARSGEVSVMVGPRSALFTPFPRLGLIIIDEEHEESYHSESMPRYHAYEVARKRGELEGARLLLGSATPSVNAAYSVQCGEYLGLRLDKRFGGSELPQTEIVDMRAELETGNRSILSGRLRQRMEEALSRREQIMLFLNRRGYSGSVTCRSCGYVVKCPHCDVSLTRHKNGKLVCHYCGYEEQEMHSCPECGSSHIGGLTIGTEQVEDIVQAGFPSARLLRMDFDTTRGKEGHSRILRSFAEGEADILIGTQMIVKGHDFPRVTLVGVLLADLSLNESDYRSSERSYQLIAQAVGRAGRGLRPGNAVIQTYSPEHFAVKAAAAQDYDAFFKEEISFRKLMRYPPAGGLLAVLSECPDEALLTLGMKYLRSFIDRIDPGQKLMAIGPAPQSVGKIRDQYRQVIYLRHDDKQMLIRAKDLMEEYIEMNRGFDEISIMFDFQ